MENYASCARLRTVLRFAINIKLLCAAMRICLIYLNWYFMQILHENRDFLLLDISPRRIQVKDIFSVCAAVKRNEKKCKFVSFEFFIPPNGKKWIKNYFYHLMAVLATKKKQLVYIIR